MDPTLLTAVLVAIIAAVPPTIVALRNGAKATLLATKADEIHILVNSNLERVKKQLAEALEKIESLETLIAEDRRVGTSRHHEPSQLRPRK